MANQCWDLECLVGAPHQYWLECIGCADRGSYDLESHFINKQTLMVKRKLESPILVKDTLIEPNVTKLVPVYGKMTNSIKLYFKNLDLKSRTDLAIVIKNQPNFVCMIDDIEIVFESSMFLIREKENIITHEDFIPHVIEPSFGIDRLMFAILDQNIWQRQSDNNRIVLSLPKALSFYDIAVFPLHKKDAMVELANTIRCKLMGNGLKCYFDDSGAVIGKKYVRCDEIGVQYVVTVDPGSLQTGIVTIRHRDTMAQDEVHYTKLNDIILKKLKN